MSLDNTLVLDDLSISPLPEQQADCSQNDTLSSTSFASDDREPLIEVDIKFVDEGEILNV